MKKMSLPNASQHDAYAINSSSKIIMDAFGRDKSLLAPATTPRASSSLNIAAFNNTKADSHNHAESSMMTANPFSSSPTTFSSDEGAGGSGSDGAESLGDASSGNNNALPLPHQNFSSSVVSRSSAASPTTSYQRQTSAPIPVFPANRRAVQIRSEDTYKTVYDRSNNNIMADSVTSLWDSRASTPPVADFAGVELLMRSQSSTSMSQARTYHFDQSEAEEDNEKDDQKLPFVRVSAEAAEIQADDAASPLPPVPCPNTTAVDALALPATFATQFRKRSVSNAHDVVVSSSNTKPTTTETAPSSTVQHLRHKQQSPPARVVPESYANVISSEAPADLASNEKIPPALSGKTPDQENLSDPWCDPDKPRKISFADVAAAAVRIRAIPVTSCQRSHFIADVTGIDVYLKKEIENYTGSFKERGVRNALLNLSEAQRRKGVIAASAGNHALGLCHHGKLLGVPVTVVMPTVAPLMKVPLCQALGGNITIVGNDVVEAKKVAMRMAREQGTMYLNGYDHPDVMAGQGSVGIEILTQVPDCDAVIVPVGGGGLICGIATAVKALKPDIKVIGVQSHRSCAFTFSMREGRAITCPVKATLADGLAVSKPGVNAVYSSLGLIDKMILVSEDYIALAILRLLEWEKLVAEGAGAIGLAAVLSGQLDEFRGKKVVIVISGGNIDTTVLGRCIERGLAVDGRLCRFAVTVTDRAGSITDLTQLIASVGVSIKDVVHERAWLKSDIFSVQVTCIVETRNATHAQQLESVLRKKFDRVVFPKTWIDIDDSSYNLPLTAPSDANKAIGH